MQNAYIIYITYMPILAVWKSQLSTFQKKLQKN